MMIDRRARVLIADADAGIRRGLCSRLLAADVFADSVADGRQAKAKLSMRQYAVVVLDLLIPNGGAERIVAMIGELPRHIRPIVLVVATAGVARSLDVDAVQIVLRRTCDLSQLCDIVQSCVRSNAAKRRPTGFLAGSAPLTSESLA